jgi:glycosyltransferase involved in cell wall biosynthesis
MTWKMTDSPLVTVIIPAYNRVDYIEQTIASVLEQTYPQVQLIVIDDGSTDGTCEKIQAFGNKLQLLTHPDHRNKGQSASINLGLRQARGKYIAILDSDDYWAPEKLDVQVNFLEKHPDIGLVYTNGYAVNAEGEIIYPIYGNNHEENNDADAVLLDCYILLPQNSLVRKAVYDEAGFFEESYRSAQDHDMLIRIAEITRFAYLQDFLFFYRRHPGSISSTQQALRWETGFRILEKAGQRHPYKRATLRKRRAVLHYRIGKVRLQEGRHLTGIVHLGRAFLLDPQRAFRVMFGLDKSR